MGKKTSKATRADKGRMSYKVIVPKVLDVVGQYTTKMTLRQIYYRLVAALVIENKQTNYKGLSAFLVKARMNGDLPFDIMEDRTRSSSGGDNSMTNPDHEFEKYLGWLKEAADDYVLPRWLDQERHVEVWLEKEALSALFEQVTDRQKVTLRPCKGYPSLTYLKEASRDLLRAEAKGKKLIILYFGDFDPSGKDIVRYLTERLADLGVSDLSVIEVALSAKQIDKHGFPPMPTKKTDSRSAAFVAEYGDIAVELDAVPPDMLQTWIDKAISKHFDTPTYDEVLEREDSEREQVREKVSEILGGDD